MLLPEPEAPTMASVSPARTSRSTPCSTVTSSRAFGEAFGQAPGLQQLPTGFGHLAGASG